MPIDDLEEIRAELARRAAADDLEEIRAELSRRKSEEPESDSSSLLKWEGPTKALPNSIASTVNRAFTQPNWQAGTEALAGGGVDALNKMFLPGDEIIAGGSALTQGIYDAIRGQDTDISGDYDRKLWAARELEGDYSKKYPKLALTNYALGLRAPVPKGLQIAEADPVLVAAGKAGQTVGAASGAQGFFSGEGETTERGLSNRLKRFSKQALEGMGIGAAIPIVAGIPGAVTRLMKSTTEEEALSHAFNVAQHPYEGAASDLQNLKAKGIIASPESQRPVANMFKQQSSPTPFAQTAKNLESELTTRNKGLTSVLKDKAVSLEEVTPSIEGWMQNNPSATAADVRAVNTVIRNEKAKLMGYALVKDPSTGTVPVSANPEAAYLKYRQLQKAASQEMTPANQEVIHAAKQELAAMDARLKSAKFTGDELWKIRQGYDEGAKFGSTGETPNNRAYKFLRGKSQGQIEALDPSLPRMFEEEASLLRPKGYVDRMALRETEAKNTQEGSALFDWIKRNNPLSGAPANPTFALRQAFGETAGQKFASGAYGEDIASALQPAAPVVLSGLNRNRRDTPMPYQEEDISAAPPEEASTGPLSSLFGATPAYADEQPIMANPMEQQPMFTGPISRDASQFNAESLNYLLESSEGDPRAVMLAGEISKAKAANNSPKLEGLLEATAEQFPHLFEAGAGVNGRIRIPAARNTYMSGLLRQAQEKKVPLAFIAKQQSAFNNERDLRILPLEEIEPIRSGQYPATTERNGHRVPNY